MIELCLFGVKNSWKSDNFRVEKCSKLDRSCFQAICWCNSNDFEPPQPLFLILSLSASLSRVSTQVYNFKCGNFFIFNLTTKYDKLKKPKIKKYFYIMLIFYFLEWILSSIINSNRNTGYMLKIRCKPFKTTAKNT